MMGWLPSSILPSEARFAHVTFAFQFAEIYVPFVQDTELSLCRGVRRGGHIDEWHVDLRKPKGGSDMGNAGLSWEDGDW
jgi:hypothetical protein